MERGVMSTIKLKNGEVESVFDRIDLLNVIESHMGYEAMRLVDRYFEELDETICDLEEQLREMNPREKTDESV